MLVIASKVASIFIVMLVGFVIYKAGVLGDEAVRPLTSLMMNVTCPCLIISSLYSKEVSPSLLGETVSVMVCVLLFYIISSVLTYLFVRITKLGNKEDIGVYIVAVAATNSGFMGFPIVKALYGNDMLYFMVMGNIMLNVYMMWMEPSILTIGSGAKVSAKNLLDGLKTPIVISMLIGFAMMIFHIRPEGVIDETMTMIGDITIPVSMILVGIRLGSVKYREVVSKNNIIISIFAMIIVPALILILVHPLGFIPDSVKIIVVMTAALPTAVVSVIIAEQYEKNSLLLSELASLTTLISVATIPCVAVILEMI